MTALAQHERIALRVVIACAIEVAGDVGPVAPPTAIGIYRAIALLEPLTRQGDPAQGVHHWTQHIDDDGTWVVRDPACPYCRTMLGHP